jgi:small subunit ribosomal protein S3Ae
MFESREIGQLVSSDEANLINRKVKIGLGDMLGSFSQSTAYTSMFFRVTEVKGKTAHTKFIGHELVPGYVRTLVRRRRSVMNQVDDVTTKDGVTVRVKSICISGLKVSEGVRADVRKGISEAVRQLAKGMDYSVLAQEMVFGKFSAKIYAAVKRIGPIKRVEIRKSVVKETFA